MEMITNTTPQTTPQIAEYILNNLPQDIVEKIYLDHFNYENRYREIETILQNERSRALNNNELTTHFRKENILKDVSFVQYLREKNNIFSEIYKTHYIDNAKQFVLMNNLESMCQCWLMYLYH
jgi:hypothetical protein